MRKSNSIFIARQITIEEWGFERIDAEAIFDSFNKAEKFIKRNADEQCSEQDLKTYRFQIISSQLNKEISWNNSETCHYDFKGKFIQKVDSKHKTFGKEFNNEFKGIYKIGDIVFIKALPWNQFSHRDLDIIGIISYKPLTLQEWLKTGEKAKDWMPLYTVDYINSRGFLDHDHFYEQGIQKSNMPIPKEHSFLKALRLHYMEKKRINRKLLNRVYNCEIMVLNYPHICQFQMDLDKENA